MDSIFSLFNKQEAIAIYVNDHGDEVNDYRIHVGRSHEVPMAVDQIRTQFEVPMFVWCSPKYIESHPDVIESIKRAVDKPFITDDMPHFLFDLAGINSPFYQETKSVINDNYAPRAKRFLLMGEGVYEDIMPK